MAGPVAPSCYNATDARVWVSSDNGLTWRPWDGESRPDTRWIGIHRPTSNTQATITISSPGAGFVLICDTLTVSFAADSSAPSATTRQPSLIAGSSGGTTYLWGTRLGIPAVAGATNGACPHGPWSAGEATALTLEFDSAGGANTFEAVTMSGRTEPV